MNEVACLITTFERPRCCRRLIKSIREHYDTRIYICDDSRNSRIKMVNDPRRAVYDSLPITNGWHLNYDVGLSFKRNRLIDNTTEPYLLFLDDDFVFTEETRIERLRTVLDADPSIGLVSGSVEGAAYEGWFRKRKRDLYFEGPAIADDEVDGIQYGYADMVPNFFLARREMFEDVRWNDKRKLSEHLEFFLDLWRTDWKVAFVPSVVVDHRPERTKEYIKLRGRTEKHINATLKKYGIERFHKYNTGAVVTRT